MTDTITVASTVHTSIRLIDPSPDATTAPGPVINGANHAEAVNGEALTHGVDAGLFHRWLDHAKANGSPMATMLREVGTEADSEPAPIPDAQPITAETPAVAPEATEATQDGPHQPDDRSSEG